MRIKSVVQKGVAVVMTMAMAFGVAGVVPNQAEAAKSAKIPVSAIYCFDGGKGDGHWTENATVSHTTGNGIKKNDKVGACKTVTFKKGKKVHVSLTIKNKTSYTSKTTKCLLVDTYGILSKFKKVKYSNVSVKCDGKSVKAKYMQGYYESKTKTLSHRLVFFNEWGDDSTKEKKFSQKYPMKKKIVISFDIVAK